MESNNIPIPITQDMLEDVSPTPQVSRRFESGISSLPPVTIAVIIFISVVFLIQLIATQDDSYAFLDVFILSRSSVMAGNYVSLISSTFMHADFQHIFGNVLALFVIGVMTEHAYGKARFIFIFILTAIMSSLASILIQTEPSVGASGAIFGIMGAMIAYAKSRPNLFSNQEKRIGGVLIFWSAYMIISGFMTPFIDNAAHIGGFFSGIILGCLIEINSHRSKPKVDHTG